MMSLFIPCEIDDIESSEPLIGFTVRLMRTRDGRYFLSPGGEIDAETGELMREKYGLDTYRRRQELLRRAIADPDGVE